MDGYNRKFFKTQIFFIVMKWDVFSDIKNVPGKMDKVFRSFESKFAPFADISEFGNKIIIRLDIPGVSKEKIDICVTDTTLEVKAKISEVKEIKKENFYKKERHYKGFHRLLKLPVRVEPSSVKADYKSGVLTIRVNKSKEVIQKKKIKIK